MYLKRFIKLCGLFVLIAFSFFYSDRVARVISSKDSLMVKINNVASSYEIKPIDGIISNNTIVPGINGRVVNVDKSYKKMREIGTFSEELIVYDYVKPNNSLALNKDKYIIHGNYNKKMVSIVMVIDDDKYLERLDYITKNKDITFNYFVTSDFLISNTNYITSLNNVEVYNYGVGGKYAPDNILFANNLITRITKNEAKYCLVDNYDNSTLSLCSKNDLYTVLPNIIIDSRLYINIKNSLDNGSIIYIKLNNNNITELSIVIDYIKGKGMEIVGLSKLISE